MIGQRIKELRKAKRLTLDELSRLSKSNKSYIWELENPRDGKKPISPSLKKLNLIANALRVPLTVLVGDENYSDMTSEEIFIISLYRKLDKQGKEKFTTVCKVVSEVLNDR